MTDETFTHKRPATIRCLGAFPPTSHLCKCKLFTACAAKRKTRNVQRHMKVRRALCANKSPTTQPISKALRTQCVGCPRDIFRQALNDANHFTQFMVLFCECVCNAQPHLLIVNPRCAIALCGRLQANAQRSLLFSTQPTDPILGTLATNAVLACLRWRNHANTYEHANPHRAHARKHANTVAHTYTQTYPRTIATKLCSKLAGPTA